MYTNIQPVVKPVWQPVWQPAVSCIQPDVKPVIKPDWQPIECVFIRYSRLYKPAVQPVWQPVVSCKRGIRIRLIRFSFSDTNVQLTGNAVVEWIFIWSIESRVYTLNENDVVLPILRWRLLMWFSPHLSVHSLLWVANVTNVFARWTHLCLSISVPRTLSNNFPYTRCRKKIWVIGHCESQQDCHGVPHINSQNVEWSSKLFRRDIQHYPKLNGCAYNTVFGSKRSQVVSVSQTLRRWTEGATYVRQGHHHVGHWPTF